MCKNNGLLAYQYDNQPASAPSFVLYIGLTYRN